MTKIIADDSRSIATLEVRVSGRGDRFGVRQSSTINGWRETGRLAGIAARVAHYACAASSRSGQRCCELGDFLVNEIGAAGAAPILATFLVAALDDAEHIVGLALPPVARGEDLRFVETAVARRFHP